MVLLRNLNRVLDEALKKRLGFSGKITFLDILEAKQKGPEALNEASLNRAIQHFNREIHKSWAIFSAFLTDYPPSQMPMSKTENRDRTKELRSILRSKDISFIKLSGQWKRCNLPVEDEDR